MLLGRYTISLDLQTLRGSIFHSGFTSKEAEVRRGNKNLSICLQTACSFQYADWRGLSDTGPGTCEGAHWIKTRAETGTSIYVRYKILKSLTGIIPVSGMKRSYGDYCYWNGHIALIWEESYQFNIITPACSFLLEALNGRCIFLWLLKMGKPIDDDLVYWISQDRLEYAGITSNSIISVLSNRPGAQRPLRLHVCGAGRGLCSASLSSLQGAGDQAAPVWHIAFLLRREVTMLDLALEMKCLAFLSQLIGQITSSGPAQPWENIAVPSYHVPGGEHIWNIWWRARMTTKLL